MNWQLLLLALGLTLIIEGLPYFLHPQGSLRMLRRIEAMGPGAVRFLGLSALVVGVVVLLFTRLVAP